MKNRSRTENADGLQRKKKSKCGEGLLKLLMVVVIMVVVTVEVSGRWWWSGAPHITATNSTHTFLQRGNLVSSSMEREGRGGEKMALSPPGARGGSQETRRGAKEEEEALPMKGYTFPNCDCVRFGVDLELLQRKEERRSSGQGGGGYSKDWLRRHFNLSGPSTCSDFATQRGGGQRVVAYSYFTPKNFTNKASINYKKYFAPLHNLARRIPTAYPDYLMRVYHNVSSRDTTATSFLCTLICTHAHLDLCDVTNLPGLGNLVEQGVVGRSWRFAVLGDPTVDIFLSRDSDSWILDREVAAVEEWLDSGRTFHIMRDHPYHGAAMLAGLWGGRNRWPEWLAGIRNKMFAEPKRPNKGYDQVLLAKHLWPKIKKDTLQHVSFTCQRHPGSVPFPTKREEDLYCGSGLYKKQERLTVSKATCPEECRPPKHPSWTSC